MDYLTGAFQILGAGPIGALGIKALHLTAIPLRSIAAGELWCYRYMLYSSAFEKPKILWYSNRIGNLSMSFVFTFFDYIGYLAKEYLISLKQTDNKLDGNKEPWKIF